ncbi:bifunctional (p)ppGpp synthetase/guanosine-3',5'-bis(diphosphate) 3'-pyrophosphohydrolase [bacterium]|nr:bifunctional (p)ppGpp synthetase/guanosine-3',5'-bis(diphosphate) 3'-pyrophosphohydrolase [bacterium]
MTQNSSIDKIQDIWLLVSKLHKGQSYGGAEEGLKIDYINHIGSVVFEIMNAIKFDSTIDEELAISCALLHDTIEDTSIDYQFIKDSFGVSIADGVLALTKNSQISGKTEQMIDSLERIKSQPKEIWCVKLADRICNLYAPPFYWNRDKKIAYLNEAKIIYNHLKDGNDYLSNRLLQKIDSYKHYIE